MIYVYCLLIIIDDAFIDVITDINNIVWLKGRMDIFVCAFRTRH